MADPCSLDVHLITERGLERHQTEEIPALLQRSDGFLWVDVPAADADTGRLLADVFGFHPLAVKDSLERNRVPKMHAYDDHVLVILHAPEHGDRGHVHYLELDQFIGPRYLITVHGPLNPAVDEASAERETRAVLHRLATGRLTPKTPVALSHAIVTALTRYQETAGLRQRFESVCGGEDCESGPDEYVLQHVGDVGVVVGYQNGGHERVRPLGSRQRLC